MSGFQKFVPKGARIPNIQQVSAQVLPGGSPSGTTQTIPYVVTGGPVVLYGLAATSTSTFISRIFLTWEQCYCDTGPVNSALLWGSAQFPTWVRPKYIPNQKAVNEQYNRWIAKGSFNLEDPHYRRQMRLKVQARYGGRTPDLIGMGRSK